MTSHPVLFCVFLSVLQSKTIQGLELNVLIFEDIRRTMANSSLKQEILEPLLKAQNLSSNSQSLHAKEPRISSSLMGNLACMQTSPLPSVVSFV